MRGHYHRPCLLTIRNVILSLFFIFSVVRGISYRCESNQVLIVQSFGNDTIRMHCQRLRLCGHDKMECGYDHEQPNCGGKLNFVAHVNQDTTTGPVRHTCCGLRLPNDKQNVAGHDGNDCFVYELPDGTNTSEKSKVRSTDDITVLKSANQIPEQFEDGYVGYRMRLFALKNKSPPTLIVKAIERASSGYRVTICRPRCGKFNKEGEASGQSIQNEEVIPSHPNPIEGKSGQWTAGKDGPEYQALQWGSWSSSTWETWKTTEWTEENDKTAAGNPGTRSRLSKVKSSKEHENSGERPSSLTAQASASASSGSDTLSGASGSGGEPRGKDDDSRESKGGKEPDPQKVVNNNNINIKAEGGQGGHASIQLPDQNGNDGQRRPGAGDDGNSNGLNAGPRKPISGQLTGHDTKGDGLEPVKEEDSEEDGRVYGRGHGKKQPKGRQHRVHQIDEAGTKSTDSDESNEEPTNSKNKQASHGKHKYSSSDSDESLSDDDDDPNKLDDLSNWIAKVLKRGRGNKGRLDKDDLDGSKSGKQEGNPDSEDLNENGLKHERTSKKNQRHGNKQPKPDSGEQTLDRQTNTPDDNPDLIDDNHSKGSKKSRPGVKARKSGKNDRHGKNNHGKALIPNNGDDLGDKQKAQEISVDSTANQKKEDDKKGNGQDAGGSGGQGAGHEQDVGDLNKQGAGNGQGVGGLGDQNAGGSHEQDAGDSDGQNAGELSKQGAGDGQGELNKQGAGDGQDIGNSNEQGGGDSSTRHEGETTSQELNPDDDNATEQTGKKSEEEESTGSDALKLPDQHVVANIETPDSEEEEDNSSGSGDEEDCDGIVFGGYNEGSGESSGEGSGEESRRRKCGNRGGKNGGRPDSEEEQAFGAVFQQQSGDRDGDQGPVNRQVTSGNNQGASQQGSGGTPSPSCFSGDTQVETAEGIKLIQDLEIGDYVLVPAAENALRYERVVMFYHREPETRVKFVRLETENRNVLALTALHLLPFGSCDEMEKSDFNADGIDEWMRKARFAHKAQVGDCVLALDNQRNVKIERIVKVGRQYSKGIYSPITIEGSLVTNNILSSCFSQIESHATQKMAFDLLMMCYSSIGYLSNMVNHAVQEIPLLLKYFHSFSWYLIPFAKY